MRHSVQGRRGTVLVVVLVAVALLTLVAFRFTELMVAEHETAEVQGRALQALALADSGVAYMGHVLAEEEAVRRQQGGLYDNPTRFQGLEVTADDSLVGLGRFSVLAPAMDASGRYVDSRFGLEDESARMNLNTLVSAGDEGENDGRERLMHLPGMTEDVADAILDWIDEDDQPRELGAEVEYYSGLDPPYAPKNGPLDTVEELLLVRGVTPALLLGADVNRNYAMDAHEAASVSLEGVDNSMGDMDRGWSAFLTLHSRKSNRPVDGQTRIDLNDQDLEKLHSDLAGVFPAEWATFIVAFRQRGPAAANVNTANANGPASGELDLTAEGGTTLASVLDLVGARVQVRFKNQERDSILTSPFPNDPGQLAESLNLLSDHTTASGESPVASQINVNQASRPALLTVPGMTEPIADAILAQRQPELEGDDSPRRHATWLLTEGLVPLDEMKQMLPHICTGGDVFRAQVVGSFDAGGPAARVEAVFDTSGGSPRLLFWRDISHLGRGWPLEDLGAASTP
jgi:hypothetical protein